MVPVVGGLTLSQVVWRFLMQGWLAVLLGALLAYLGAAEWDRAAPFSAGVSLVVVGMGLMLRRALELAGMRPDLRDRIAFTITGVVVLAYWLTPADVIESVAGELVGDFDLLFVSGISMVTAAVWTVMYNSDLLLRALTLLTSPIGKLRPVLVTAVAYPMSAKLRDGTHACHVRPGLLHTHVHVRADRDLRHASSRTRTWLPGAGTSRGRSAPARRWRTCARRWWTVDCSRMTFSPWAATRSQTCRCASRAAKAESGSR